MFLAQLVEDHRAGRRTVTQDATPRTARELRDQRIGKPVRVGRERFREDEAAELPVTGRAVLTRTHRLQDAVRRHRGRHRSEAPDRRTATEPEALEVREYQPTDVAGDIPQGIAPGIAVRRRIRCGAASQPIEDDDRRATRAAHGSAPLYRRSTRDESDVSSS